MLYERICKDVMALESNIKAIRPITAALTCLLTELRDSSKRQGETKRAQSHPNLPQVKQIMPDHYD